VFVVFKKDSGEKFQKIERVVVGFLFFLKKIKKTKQATPGRKLNSERKEGWEKEAPGLKERKKLRCW
jgi:hypothetical protein